MSKGIFTVIKSMKIGETSDFLFEPGPEFRAERSSFAEIEEYILSGQAALFRIRLAREWESLKQVFA